MSTGFLEEHEYRGGSANAGPDSNVPEMDDEEKKLVKLVNHLFEKAKRHRAKYDCNWIDYYRIFRGDQWTKKRPSYRHSEVINFIFMTIQSMVPIMLDSRPRPVFTPRDPGDTEFAEILNELFEADWQSGNWLMKIAEVIYDGHFYGTGFAKLDWDEHALYGLGKIRFKSEEPLDFYPDPDANHINESEEDSSYVVTMKPTDTEKLRLKYRGHKFESAIKPDVIDPAAEIP